MMRSWLSAVVWSRSSASIVVDGFRDTYDGNALFVELLCHCERAVAADADEAFDIELFDSLGNALEQFGVKLNAALNAHGGGEAPLVGRPQDRPALRENAGGVFGGQLDVLDGVGETLVALEETHAIVAKLPRRLHHATDDRVQAWTIAAAGQNADAFVGHRKSKGVEFLESSL
jgi:hypothetical protein